MKILIFLFAFFITSPAFADLFNGKLTQPEQEALAKGEIVVRSLDSVKKLSISEIDETKKIIKEIKSVSPNYIAEIIQIRPFKGNENLLQNLEDAITDIPAYENIPYFSERNQKTYMLYDETKLKRWVNEKGSEYMIADLKMSGFSNFTADFTIEKTEETYYCCMRNLGVIRYHDKYNAVGEKKMRSAISVFRDGDNWVLYVLSGISAPRLAPIEKRVETSFVNRMKSFCAYIAERI